MPPTKPFPLPEAAYSQQSIQEFRNQSQVRLDLIAKAQGKTSPKIKLSDIKVDPGAPGDGLYDLVYQNKELDALLMGQVSTLNQDMRLVNKRVTDSEKFYIFHYAPLKDTCTLTETLLGPGELDGLNCQDAWLEPELQQAKGQFESLQVFENYCKNSFQKFLEKNPQFKGRVPYEFSRSTIQNPQVGDRQFSLLYHDPSTDFFCRAQIPSFGEQTMVMGAGQFLKGGEDAKLLGDPQTHPMTDACRLTNALVGPEEHLGHCLEFSTNERAGITAVDYSWKSLMLGLGAYEGASILTWGSDKILKHGYYAKTFKKWGDPVRWMGRKVTSPFRASTKVSTSAAGSTLTRSRWLPRGASAVANALIAGWVYDKATGMYLAPEHPVRKYGTYGAAGVGALSPMIWKRLAGTQAFKALSARALATPALGGVLSKLGSARLGARFLAVMGLNYGIRYLLVDGQYDAGVNQRVTKQIYDEHVYGYNLFNPIALVRAGCRELAPEAMEWAVAMDNDDLKAAVLKQDRKDSEQATRAYALILHQVLQDPSFYDPSNPDSFSQLDLSKLENTISLNDTEEKLKSHLENQKEPKSFQEDFGYSDPEMAAMLQRVFLKQMQDMAAFLVAVDQPLNNWARGAFNENGTLKPGMDTLVLTKLETQLGPDEIPFMEIPMTRRLHVSLSYLKGDSKWQGHEMEAIAKKAKVVDETGRLVMNDVTLAALSLYMSSVLESPKNQDIQRLNETFYDLQERYLVAMEPERQMLGQALQIMGVDLEAQTGKSYRPGHSPIDKLFPQADLEAILNPKLAN